MKTIDIMAIDIGASNGRSVLGSFDGQILKLSETGRVPNGPKLLVNKYYWDI